MMQTTLSEIKFIIIHHDCYIHNCRSRQIKPIFTNFIFVHLRGLNFVMKSFLCVHELVQNGNFKLIVTRVHY